MSIIKDFFKQKKDETTAADEAILQGVQDKLAPDVKHAEQELPKILAAYKTAENWCAQHIDCFDWKSVGGLPKEMGQLVDAIAALKNNAGVIQGGVSEFQTLTIRDVRGSRADGEPDRNRPQVVATGIQARLKLARGCEAAILNYLKRLKFALEQFEERQRYFQQTAARAPDAVMIVMPEPSPQPAKVAIPPRIDVRVR